MIDFEITNTMTPEEYMEMRRMVGWGLFPLEQAAEGLNNSFILLCLRRNSKPIGLGRVVSDRGYIYYIADILVCPEYQGQGLGRVIMEMIMKDIRDSLRPAYRAMISLSSAKGKEGFYNKFGFLNRPNEDVGCGMYQWIENCTDARDE